ncbi:MAG: hypothetical protein IT567_01070 [Alphaproteobacteria bacterium]|nr:hypothetical protein [Alphaproteobacteria bacterium]
MSVYEWDKKSGSPIQRIDVKNVRKGMGTGRVDEYTAIIYPPEGVEDGQLADLPEYLRGQGFNISEGIAKDPDEAVLRVSNFPDPKLLEATVQRLTKAKFKVRQTGNSIEITGFETERGLENTYRQFLNYGQGIEVKRDVNRGRVYPVLQVREKGSEEALMGALRARNYLQGPPKDPFEGMTAGQKAWKQIQMNIKEYAGWLYLIGDSIALSSGFRRGNLGEIGMGLFFASGSLFLIAGKKKPRTPEELISGAVKDFSIDAKDGIVDFGKFKGFSSGNEHGAIADYATEISASHGTEIMTGVNAAAGVSSLVGSIKEGVTRYERTNPKNKLSVKLDADTGRPEIKRSLDVPQFFTGLLLAIGWTPVTFIPQKDSDKKPFLVDFFKAGRELPVLKQLVDVGSALANTGPGKIVTFYPRQIWNWIEEAPLRFAGSSARLHNFQQMGFAVREGIESRKEIKEFKEAFARVSEIWTESGWAGHFGVATFSENFLSTLLAQKFATFSKITAMEANISIEREALDRAILQAGPPSDKPSGENPWKNIYRILSSDEALTPQERECSALLARLTDSKDVTAISDALEYYRTEKPYNLLGLMMHETALYKAISDLGNKETYQQVIKQYEEQAAKAGDGVNNRDRAIYSMAKAREEYEKLEEKKNNFWLRLTYNSVFVAANSLFAHADAGVAHKVNLAEEMFDMEEVYRLGSNLLREKGWADDKNAVGNLAMQLANQPEMKVRHIAPERIAEGLQAHIDGRPTREVEIARQSHSPWAQTPQQKVSISANDGTPSFTQKLASQPRPMVQPKDLTPEAIKEGSRADLPLVV